MEIDKETREKGKVIKKEEEIGRCLDCQRLFPIDVLKEVRLIDPQSHDREESAYLCRVCHNAIKQRGNTQR